MHEDYTDAAATLGDRIAAAREAAGMAQKETAHSLGVRLRTLRGWEEDRAEPRADRVRVLAGMLGVSLTWLLTGAGAGPTEQKGEVADLAAELRAARAELMAAHDRLERLEARLREAMS